MGQKTDKKVSSKISEENGYVQNGSKPPKRGNQTNSVGLISMANITHFPLKFKMHFQWKNISKMNELKAGRMTQNSAQNFSQWIFWFYDDVAQF